MLDTIPLRKQEPSQEKLMGWQSDPETLLRFPELAVVGNEAGTDLGNGCCPIGGHVRRQESELLCTDFVNVL